MPHIGRGNKRSTVPDEAIVELINEGYKVNEISYRLGVWAQRVRNLVNASQWQESALNRATTARYQKCQDNGGCAPSSVYIVRPFATGDLDLPLCEKCGVPVWSREIKSLARSREIAKQRGRDQWAA